MRGAQVLLKKQLTWLTQPNQLGIRGAQVLLQITYPCTPSIHTIIETIKQHFISNGKMTMNLGITQHYLCNIASKQSGVPSHLLVASYAQIGMDFCISKCCQENCIAAQLIHHWKKLDKCQHSGILRLSIFLFLYTVGQKIEAIFFYFCPQWDLNQKTWHFPLSEFSEIF